MKSKNEVKKPTEQDPDVVEFVKKMEPHLVELIQNKLGDTKTIEMFSPVQLVIDINKKIMEWCEVIKKSDTAGSQLEIETLLSLSARAMMLVWVRERTMDNQQIMNSEVI